MGIQGQCVVRKLGLAMHTKFEVSSSRDIFVRFDYLIQTKFKVTKMIKAVSNTF